MKFATIASSLIASAYAGNDSYRPFDGEVISQQKAVDTTTRFSKHTKDTACVTDFEKNPKNPFTTVKDSYSYVQIAIEKRAALLDFVAEVDGLFKNEFAKIPLSDEEFKAQAGEIRELHAHLEAEAKVFLQEILTARDIDIPSLFQKRFGENLKRIEGLYALNQPCGAFISIEDMDHRFQLFASPPVPEESEVNTDVKGDVDEAFEEARLKALKWVAEMYARLEERKKWMAMAADLTADLKAFLQAVLDADNLRQHSLNVKPAAVHSTLKRATELKDTLDNRHDITKSIRNTAQNLIAAFANGKVGSGDLKPATRPVVSKNFEDGLHEIKKDSKAAFERMVKIDGLEGGENAQPTHKTSFVQLSEPAISTTKSTNSGDATSTSTNIHTDDDSTFVPSASDEDTPADASIDEAQGAIKPHEASIPEEVEEEENTAFDDGEEVVEPELLPSKEIHADVEKHDGTTEERRVIPNPSEEGATRGAYHPSKNEKVPVAMRKAASVYEDIFDDLHVSELPDLSLSLDLTLNANERLVLKLAKHAENIAALGAKLAEKVDTFVEDREHFPVEKADFSNTEKIMEQALRVKHNIQKWAHEVARLSTIETSEGERVNLVDELDTLLITSCESHPYVSDDAPCPTQGISALYSSSFMIDEDRNQDRPIRHAIRRIKESLKLKAIEAAEAYRDEAFLHALRICLEYAEDQSPLDKDVIDAKCDANVQVPSDIQAALNAWRTGKGLEQYTAIVNVDESRTAPVREPEEGHSTTDTDQTDFTGGDETNHESGDLTGDETNYESGDLDTVEGDADAGAELADDNSSASLSFINGEAISFVENDNVDVPPCPRPDPISDRRWRGRKSEEKQEKDEDPEPEPMAIEDDHKEEPQKEEPQREETHDDDGGKDEDNFQPTPEEHEPDVVIDQSDVFEITDFPDEDTGSNRDSKPLRGAYDDSLDEFHVNGAVKKEMEFNYQDDSNRVYERDIIGEDELVDINDLKHGEVGQLAVQLIKQTNKFLKELITVPRECTPFEKLDRTVNNTSDINTYVKEAMAAAKAAEARVTSLANSARASATKVEERISQLEAIHAERFGEAPTELGPRAIRTYAYDPTTIKTFSEFVEVERGCKRIAAELEHQKERIDNDRQEICRAEQSCLISQAAHNTQILRKVERKMNRLQVLNHHIASISTGLSSKAQDYEKLVNELRSKADEKFLTEKARKEICAWFAAFEPAGTLENWQEQRNAFECDEHKDRLEAPIQQLKEWMASLASQKAPVEEDIPASFLAEAQSKELKGCKPAQLAFLDPKEFDSSSIHNRLLDSVQEDREAVRSRVKLIRETIADKVVKAEKEAFGVDIDPLRINYMVEDIFRAGVESDRSPFEDFVGASKGGMTSAMANGVIYTVSNTLQRIETSFHDLASKDAEMLLSVGGAPAVHSTEQARGEYEKRRDDKINTRLEALAKAVQISRDAFTKATQDVSSVRRVVSQLQQELESDDSTSRTEFETVAERLKKRDQELRTALSAVNGECPFLPAVDLDPLVSELEEQDMQAEHSDAEASRKYKPEKSKGDSTEEDNHGHGVDFQDAEDSNISDIGDNQIDSNHATEPEPDHQPEEGHDEEEGEVTGVEIPAEYDSAVHPGSFAQINQQDRIAQRFGHGKMRF